jgi:hypothetical protein
VFLLYVFQSSSPVPLLQHFLKLLIFVESGSCKFSSPPWYMVLSSSRVYVTFVNICYCSLVIGSHFERPNVVFVKTVIDQRHVGIRGVCVY